MIAYSVHCRRRALGWMAMHPSRRGAGCEMGRRRRSFGGWECSRALRSAAGVGSMHCGDEHPRRGASSGWMVVPPSYLGVGCEMVRRRRSSRGVESVGDDRSCMRLGDVHFRRVASSRRCSCGGDVKELEAL